MAENRFAKYMTNGSVAYAPQREEERQPVRRRKAVQKVYTRSQVNALPVAYVFVVAIACALLLASSVIFLHARTNLTIMTKQVSSLQTELEAKKQSNQDLQNEISASTTLSVIRDKALELGMKQADAAQIIFYTATEKDYVRQKDNIPNEN